MPQESARVAGVNSRSARSSSPQAESTGSETVATSSVLDSSSEKVSEQRADMATDIVGSRHSGRILFRPSRDLAELAPCSVNDRGIPSLLASLSEEHISRVCNDYALEEALILKWRDTAKVKVV